MNFTKPLASIAAFCALLSAQTLSATDQIATALILQPTSNWQVDYAERECRLTRTFGAGKDAIFFRLARGTSFGKFDVILAGLSIPKQTGYVQLKVKVGLDGKDEEFRAESQAVPGRLERLLRWFDGDLEPLKNGLKDQLLSVIQGKKYAVRLNLQNLPAAIIAMQACHDDLLRSWEIDPGSLAKFQALPVPIGNPGEWVSTDDYPGNLLSDGIHGTVAFKIKVGTDGKPVDCVVLESSKIEALDKLSCQLVVQRARFKPAIGSDGQPAVAPYINRIRWQIPE